MSKPTFTHDGGQHDALMAGMGGKLSLPSHEAQHTISHLVDDDFLFWIPHRTL
jgi:hypothetical protein